MLNTILSIPTYQEPSTAFVALWIICIVFIGLGILGTLAAGIFGLIDDDDELKPCLFGTLALSGLILLPIWALTATIDNNKHYPEWYESEIVEVQYDHIYSLDLNSEVNGHFLLGNGSVSTDNYYYFYIKNSKDLFSLTKVKINSNVYLKESDTSPRVEERKDANSIEIYTVIYVPVGTVIDYGYTPH